ncbi:MAG: hypothetical protein HOQ24_03340 [Mycobacteriaceae bacterium]|nr:hypothetical protein [Mycobacteriaceae bacterium]
MTALARRRRRRLLVLVAAFLALPLLVGALASAQSPVVSSTQAEPTSALDWTGVRDSDGVPLSRYTFAVGEARLFDPIGTAFSVVLALEFNGWWVLMVMALWLIGYAMGFRWLEWFAKALRGVAEAFTGQLVTNTVMVTAVTVGAFFVAYFVARQMYARAVRQIITMAAVAVLGVLFLAEPLGEVLGPDGWLAKGRDVGISVAAGLHGQANPDPDRTVSAMQTVAADTLVRKPLQVWNFGHVLDGSGTCGAAWSSGVRSGDRQHLLNLVRSCGDDSAVRSATQPAMGQLGVGLVLLVSGCILIGFAAVLAIRLIRSSLDCVYHGFMAIFGFAAGGYMYGPTQTYLIRNLVDSVMAACAMAAYTVFLGIYMLFLGNLMDQAEGEVFAVIVISAIVMVIAVTQMRRLQASLERGGHWVAGRFAAATQGAGGGGDGALGMGPGATGHALTGLHMMSMLTALNTLNSNPLVGLAFGRKSPFDKYARDRQVAEIRNMDLARYRAIVRENNVNVARKAAQTVGGMHTPYGVAKAVDALRDRKMDDDQLLPVLGELGADSDTVNAILVSSAATRSTTPTNPYLFGPLQRAIATWNVAWNRQAPAVGTAAHSAYVAQAVVAFDNLARNAITPGPFASDAERDAKTVNSPFVAKVHANWDSKAALSRAISRDDWEQVDRDTRLYLGKDTTARARDVVATYYRDPTPENAKEVNVWVKRLLNLDFPEPEDGPDAFSVTPGKGVRRPTP